MYVCTVVKHTENISNVLVPLWYSVGQLQIFIQPSSEKLYARWHSEKKMQVQPHVAAGASHPPTLAMFLSCMAAAYSYIFCLSSVFMYVMTKYECCL